MALSLLKATPHKAQNHVEATLREAFVLLEPQLKPPFPLASPSSQVYPKLNQAILYGVLTQPQFTKIYFTYLHAIVIDGYEVFVSFILQIGFELYPRLLFPVKVQLIEVTKELVRVSAVGVESLLVALMRQIVGGDFSDENLWLCKELLKIFFENWDWLVEEPLLLTSVLFVYLRLLADHYRFQDVPRLEALKRMEIDFCCRVLRNHFTLCFRIGRDLIRLLQDLVGIPEFLAIWKDLLLNPAEFRTLGFLDISQLYCPRTSSKYHLLRITPEMENQLRFLLTHVKFGDQKRYQIWFARRFFFTHESETVIVDVVRFICCAHHPPNEIIQSGIIPRWAIIGWLLKSCTNSRVKTNTELALFYDWLFYNEQVDNIMNIEPGILLMMNSIPKYIDITHTLLEFLFHLVDNYDVKRKDIILRGVSTAFGILIRKGVVHSFEALISCTSLSPRLRERVANIFSKQVSEAKFSTFTTNQLK